MKKRFLILVGLVLLWAGPGRSGEVPVARVRGSVMTIEVGSDVGLAVGMEVSVVRPPGQTIVHPITGENLGAPAVEIGRGSISKISAHAASVRLNDTPLMAVRPGDLVRFMTQEEELVREQERVVVTQQRNEQEHQEMRGEVARLAKGVKDVQGRIGALEGMMRRIERIEEGLRSQLRGINNDIAGMKGDIKELKELVSLYGPVPVSGLGEQKGTTPPLPGATGAMPTAAPVPAGAVPASGGLDLNTEEGRNQVRGIIRDELQQQQSLNASAGAVTSTVPTSAPPVESQGAALPEPVTTAPAPEPTPTVVEPPPPAQTETLPADDLTIPEPPAKESFWQKSWFYGIIAGLGIIAIVAYLYVRMTSGNEEDEEDEEDEEEAEEEEVEVEEEEEDDIVVEETS
ncbi:MAG: hypothetical protein WDA75_22620 [Candidatus Latescibacterota bacterium]|jgi:hypothetical protein